MTLNGWLWAPLLATVAISFGCESATWRTVRTNPDSDGLSVRSISFAMDRSAWVVSAAGRVERSDDGSLWTIVKDGCCDELFNGVLFGESARGWLYGARGVPGAQKAAVWSTEDGGERWVLLDLPDISESVFAIARCNDDQVIAVTAHFILVNRQNGFARIGRHDAADDPLIGVACTTTGAVVAASLQGHLLRSSDFGQTWNVFNIVRSRAAVHALITSETAVWLVGESGLILRSIDDGITWHQVNVSTRQDLWSLRLAGTSGWAVGEGGVLLRTADGGDTWTTTRSPTHVDLFAVAASPTGQWLAGGKFNTILTRNR